MIPVKQETPDMEAHFGCYENCHFCRKPTDMWHENTNNPVCRECAPKHKVAELPDHGRAIRNRKRRERRALLANDQVKS